MVRDHLTILGCIDDLVVWNQNADEMVTQVWKTVALLEWFGLIVKGISRVLHPPLRSPGHVGTTAEVVTPDSGPSCHFKPSKGEFKKTAGNLTRSNSLCSTVKSKSKAPSPPRVKARVFDHETDRDYPDKFHPHIIKGLKPWKRMKEWLHPESFQPHEAQSQCWTDAFTTEWGFVTLSREHVIQSEWNCRRGYTRSGL